MKKLFLIVFGLCTIFNTFTSVASNTAAAADTTGAIIILKDDSAYKQILAAVEKGSTAEAKDTATGVEPTNPQIDIDEWKTEFNEMIHSVSNWFKEEKMSFLIMAVGMVATFFLAWFINAIFWNVVARLAHRTKTNYDDMFISSLRTPNLAFLCTIGFFLSAKPIFESLTPGAMMVWGRAFAAIASFCVFWGTFRAIGVLDIFLKRLAERPEVNFDILLATLIRKTLKIIIIIFAVIFIGQNILKLNITALLAGAGVAGLALAFAAQETLANFLGSIMIILDRPFSVGDRVKVNNVDGVVEYLGFRSTRIRALDGNLFALPNHQVATNTIENVSLRPHIKHIFQIGLVYETTPEKMKRARVILEELLDRKDWFNLEEHPPMIHFTGFGAFSLDFTIVCWFDTQDFPQFRNWLHELNMQILERFNAEGLSFAFPTSTVHLAGNSSDKKTPETV